MNWEVISNNRSSLQVYRLNDNGLCHVILKYNPRHQSARITCGHHHLLVFLESAGSLSGKTIFRNQYGMETGNLLHDKFHPREGSIKIDTKRYHYQLSDTGTPGLAIYEPDHQNPLVVCGIPAKNEFSLNTESTVNNCYLLGLCWYLSLDAVKEKENILKYEPAGV